MNSRLHSVLLIATCSVLACTYIALLGAEDRPNIATPPYWAYAVNPDASSTALAPNDKLLHLPGSAAAFTLAQVQDFFNPPDWHPDGHRPMPPVVAHGRAPDLYACGYCHLPNGQGRPENSRLAGLPAGYIIRQLADFKSGLRKSSEPKHKPALNMIRVASVASDQEAQAAAEYFSRLEAKPWIRVVETNAVPKTHVAGWMLIPSEPAATEPVSGRIIEVPENVERTELRDDASGFVAYVPQGSIARGKFLVTTGSGGRTVPCAKCHGLGTPRYGKRAPDCRPIAELHRAANLRYSERRSKGNTGPADEGSYG